MFKQKVAAIWKFLTVLLLGIAAGIWAAVKYLFPPTTEIRVGNIKIKGRENQVDDLLDLKVTPETSPTKNKKYIRKEKREERKDLRLERRKNRKPDQKSPDL
jgi:hypothetical protein